MWLRRLFQLKRSKLAALLAICSVGLALLPKLPQEETCCMASGEARPACCPPHEEERTRPSAESTCCQHITSEALLPASLLTSRSSLSLTRPDIVQAPSFDPSLYLAKNILLCFVGYTENFPTGPPDTGPIYLRKQTFLI